MRKRWTLVGVGLLALVGAAIVWTLLRPSGSPLLEPLPVERKVVGTLPRPPQPAGTRIDRYEYSAATLVDFDGDAFPELLAVGSVLKAPFYKPDYTAWLSIKDGATDQIPLVSLTPSVPTTSGDLTAPASLPLGSLPLARQVIAWDPTRLEPLVLTRNAQGWQTEPLDALKGEPLSNAVALDADHNGLIDNYWLRTQSGKLAILQLDSDRRLQVQTVRASTPSPIRKYFALNHQMLFPNVSGASVAPGTIQGIRKQIPDVDGDRQPEWVESGDSARGQKAHLVLSRSQRRVHLTITELSLTAQVEAVELDGAAPREVVVIHQSMSTLFVEVYRVDGGALQLLTMLQTPLAHAWQTYWLSDLDSDGRAELILADLPSSPSRRIRWRIFRFQNGVLEEIASFQQPLGYRVRHLHRQKQIQSGFYLSADHNPLFSNLTGAGGSIAVLATRPPGAVALQPATWRFTTLEDVFPVWNGDCDGDGREEMVLSHWHYNTYLLQVRDGKVYGVKLSGKGCSLVLPARLGDEEWLILVYRDGVVERVRVGVP
ncbi:MAG: hypothetical protein ACK4UU_01555 [Fimbriimonadales bacterium]